MTGHKLEFIWNSCINWNSYGNGRAYIGIHMEFMYKFESYENGSSYIGIHMKFMYKLDSYGNGRV